MNRNEKKFHKDKIRKNNILKELKDVDLKFANLLKEQNINKIIFTSMGNSISFGFTLTHKIKPLLKRNIFLENILQQNGIEYSMFNFARPQDNNDEHILDWIVNNNKLSYINKFINIDLGKSDNSMKNIDISDEDIQKFYPLYPKDDIGLKDIIELKENGLVNIIIYNGLTGSFLDNITRNGYRNFIKRIL